MIEDPNCPIGRERGNHPADTPGCTCRAGMTDAELSAALHQLAGRLSMWAARCDVDTYDGVTYVTICGFTRKTDAPDAHRLHMTAHTLLRQHRENYELLIMRGMP